MVKTIKLRMLFFFVMNIMCLWWVFNGPLRSAGEVARVEGRVHSADCVITAVRTGTLSVRLANEEYTAGGVLWNVCEKYAHQVGAWAVIEYNKDNNTIIGLRIDDNKVLVKEEVAAGSSIFWLVVFLWLDVAFFWALFVVPRKKYNS